MYLLKLKFLSSRSLVANLKRFRLLFFGLVSLSLVYHLFCLISEFHSGVVKGPEQWLQILEMGPFVEVIPLLNGLLVFSSLKLNQPFLIFEDT